MKARILNLLCGAGCLVLLTVLQAQHFNRLGQSDTSTLNSLKLENEVSLLSQLPSLGFDNLLADWAFLRFLQYFGDDAERQLTGYAITPKFFEGILANDPYFADFYLFLHNTVSIYAGQPETAVTLSEAALPNLSPNRPADAFYPWRYKAIDELLFLGDGEAAQTSFEIAADWAAQSSLPEASKLSELSAETAAFLAKNPQSRSAQIDAWAGLLSNSTDEVVQRLAVERIEALGGEIRLTESGQFSISYPAEE
ncbi:MAG: hypothetical protein AAFU71_15575 [Cyanobacteria bacterium J06632_22]